MVFVLVFIPWLVIYEWVVYRGPLPGAFQTYLPGELKWPIWSWMEIFYVSPYVLVTAAPLLAPTNRGLRHFTISGMASALIIFTIFVTIPALATPRPFQPQGILGQMMRLDRWLDNNNGTAAFPSFHFVWALLGAAIFAERYPRAADAWWAWTLAVGASCVLTGMHSLLDVIAGGLVFLLTLYFQALWARFRWSRHQAR